MKWKKAVERSKILWERTEEELKKQSEIYADVYDVLENYCLRPVMTGGTLLGAYRDGDFIKWDWDGEISIRRKDGNNLKRALKKLKKKYQVRGGKGYAVIILDKSGWWVEIFIWESEDNYVINYVTGEQSVLPFKFLDQVSECELRGKKYRSPDDIEGYLVFSYGDWQTPKKIRDCTEYLTSERFVMKDE